MVVQIQVGQIQYSAELRAIRSCRRAGATAGPASGVQIASNFFQAQWNGELQALSFCLISSIRNVEVCSAGNLQISRNVQDFVPLSFERDLFVEEKL